MLNPYAKLLTFPDQTTRLRRDHEKYLTLIDAIAYLHQHQRAVKSAQRGDQVIEYIEASIEDIELANRLAHDVLGRSLDELPPQTRRLLKLIDGYVVAECERLKVKRCDLRFSRRSLREAINWGDTQLRVHLERLLEMEYLLAHREGAGGKFVYELAYEVKNDERAQVAGLIEVEALAQLDAEKSTATIRKSRGVAPEVAGRSRGDSGPVAAMSRGGELAAESHGMGVAADPQKVSAKTHIMKGNGKNRSYPQPLPLAAAAR